MGKLSEWIVSRRYWILGVMVCLAIVCAFLFFRVSVNYDMTKYLPDDSVMKIGMDIMDREFPSMGADKTIRVMAEGLDEEKQAELLEKLKAIPYVESVAHDDSEKYHQSDRSLFVISTSYEYSSPEEDSIEEALEKDFEEYGIVYRNDNPGSEMVPMWLVTFAVLLLIAILVIMCESWFEPVLFLVNIGIAVLINEGTNIILGEISYTTSSIAAILQLVLSIDYSVMLMNRYRQEKALGLGKCEAMAAALRNCFTSVSSSALTTAVGMLALAFMRFKIGLDLGVVLAKGVMISLFCVLTVLPGLVILADSLIFKTAKKTPHIPMGWLARFSSRFRYVLTGAFVIMFIAFYFLQGGTQVVYTLAKVDPIADIFPADNLVVVVYENQDEEKMAQLSEQLESVDGVNQVMGYPGIFGKAYTAAELAESMDSLTGSMGGMNLPAEDSGPSDEVERDSDREEGNHPSGEGTDQPCTDEKTSGSSSAEGADQSDKNEKTSDSTSGGFSFDPAMIDFVYSMYFAGSDLPESERKLTIPELFNYVNDSLLDNPIFGKLISPEIRETVTGSKEMLDYGMSMLKSDDWSRMIIYTSLPVESEETQALMELLTEKGNELTGEYYLIGNSPMSFEMQNSFSRELRTITLLTAAAIFLIVLISFRSFIVPVLLVLIVQCGVYITVTVVGWQGYSIYFLALLIVECILMGATIDYGILFTSYFRENRRRQRAAAAAGSASERMVKNSTEMFEALKAAYDGSIHSIMTSGLIIVLVTGILGYTYSDPTVAEICRTISTGALSAILLILFLLPGMLAAFDGILSRRKA